MFKALAFLMTFSSVAFAQQDLSIPGEKWEARPSGYICQPAGAPVEVPGLHRAMNLRFEHVRTDQTLDNGLIKATFVENNSTCRYSAVLFADNTASTIRLVQSRAFPVNGSSNCARGKSVLDAQLANNRYLYWGRPHHLTIVIPTPEAERICGRGVTHVGLDFTVAGRLPQGN